MARAFSESSSRYPVISPSGRRDRSRQISPSRPGSPLTGSTSTTEYPGSGRPIEPARTGWPGVFPTCAVVSVWPNPSRTVIPQALRTCSITSGFSGSPAATHSRKRRHVRGAQFRLDEHPPHRGRRAERRHLARTERGQQRGRREPLVVQHQHGGARVPRRVHVAPGVLGPARRGQVQVHVARLDADPVHGRQVPHRVADLRVRDQLGQRRGPRGEVEQQRIRGPGDALWHERGGTGERGRVRMPPRPAASPSTTIRVQSPGTAANFGTPAASVMTCRTCPRATRSTRSAGCSSVDAGMITAPELHRGQDDLPQRRHVAEHQQHPVAPRHAEPAQPARHLR